MNDEYDPTRPFQPSDADADLDWEDDEGSPKLLWGRVLALAGILLLAFLLGRATAPDDASEDVNELRAQLEEANELIADLEEDVAPIDSPATVTTTPTDETDGGTDGDGGDGNDAPPTPEGEVKEYTVQEGDTFYTIAEDEFGEVNPDIVDCLVDANDGDDVIAPGDEVNIPETCADAG